MRIDMNRIRHRRLEQALQTTALILALGGLAAFLGFLLGGPLLAGLAVALAAGGIVAGHRQGGALLLRCLLYTSPSPRDTALSRMPSSA